MLLLQENRTHEKELPTRASRVIETEEGGPGKICLYHGRVGKTIASITRAKVQRGSFNDFLPVNISFAFENKFT
jgi:hypothetical protein